MHDGPLTLLSRAKPLSQRNARGGRAVFIDKDGTLVEDVPYNVEPDALVFAAGACAALARLADAGFALIVVTNQPGIALGLFDERALARLAQALSERLIEHGIRLDGFYACPHAPPADPARPHCNCRKPLAGLLEQAARDRGLDLARCWMVGDILNDVEAGRRAGCRSVLLDVGNETEWQLTPMRTPDFQVGDWSAAAEAILGAGA